MCAIPSCVRGKTGPIVLDKVQTRMLHSTCCHLTAAAAALAKLERWLDANITDESARYCFSCRRRIKGKHCRDCDFATGDYEDAAGLAQDTRGARFTIEEALSWLAGEADALAELHKLDLVISASMPIRATERNPVGLVTADDAMQAAYESLGVLADQLDEQRGAENRRGLHRQVSGFWWQIQACCSLVGSHRVGDRDGAWRKSSPITACV